MVKMPRSQSNRIAEFAALLLGFAVVACLVVPVPLLLMAMAAVGLALSPAPGDDTLRGPGRTWLRRLPVYAGVSVASMVISFVWFHPEPGAFLSFPLWGAFTAVWYLRGGTHLLGDRLVANMASRVPRMTFQSLRLLERVSVWRLDLVLGPAVLCCTFEFLGKRMLPGIWPPAGLSAFLAPPGFALVSYFAGAVALYSWALARARRAGLSPAGENLRWTALVAAWLYLLAYLMTPNQHGTPDAEWYGTMLGDMLRQVHAGVFPVFVGQSEYQFNGAIYSIRVAPAFHYFGALVDALSFRSLAPFAVQNLLLSLVGLLALFSAYFSVAAAIPRHRWYACALAILFVSCPGILGLAFNTDLYMSWMTVAFIPPVYLGVVRSFRRDDVAALLLMGGGLGMLWWGHTPIALWTTILVGAAQGIRLWRRWPGRAGLGRAALGLGLFALIAGYPVVSVLGFPPEPGVKSASFQVATVGNILNFLRQVFPAVLLPMDAAGRSLSDFQFGYGLWALEFLCLWTLSRVRDLEFRVLVGIAALVTLLLSPIPGLSWVLWSLVPAFVRDVTNNWVMNRLYLVGGSALIFGSALALDGLRAGAGPRGRRMLALLLLAACGWSLREAGKFSNARSSTLPPSQALRPENAKITRFAYLVFPRLPDYFTHGVADPDLESRILSPGGAFLADTDVAAILARADAGGPGARRVLSTTFGPEAPGQNRTILATRQPLVLLPGRRYLAQFDCAAGTPREGVLQFSGPTLFREYALPEYGGPRSFGIGGDHENWLPLWTSGTRPETVAVRFIPTGDSVVAGERPFARLRLIDYDPGALPIRMEGWIPYRARVRASAPGLLETPRMYQTAYRATVNGVPATVVKSPQGLVSVPVPSGESEVRVAYRPPFLLAAAFWVSFAAALAWTLWAPGFVIGAGIGPRRGGPQPAATP